MAPKRRLKTLGRVLDQTDFEALEAEHPRIATAIESEVAEGATAAEIKRFAIDREMPREWVRWLEHAAHAARRVAE